jgi:DNA-directed RNA polymerase subunit RPC12/RpoP
MNRLPLADTLSKAVGPLEKYETENEDMSNWPDLPSYIEEKIGIFLANEKRRKRQMQLQKMFSDRVVNFRCKVCNATIDSVIFITQTGENKCFHCGSWFKWLCPGCGSKLDFDKGTDTWFCKGCGAVFERPVLRSSDFTFIRAPA